METKIKANHKVGDVFLEQDGWGRIIVAANMGGDNVYTHIYLNVDTLGLSSTFYTNTSNIMPDDAKYLFNLCDLFRSTKEAVNEDTNS